MSGPRFPNDYSAVVRANHGRAIGWVVAASGQCLEIRDEEVAVVKRNLRPIDPNSLPGLPLKGSWMLGVLLCPGDDVRQVAAWVVRLNASDRGRIRFYHHPRVDLVEALAAWFEADLEPPITAEVSDFGSFHKQFGRDFNNQVYRDFAP